MKSALFPGGLSVSDLMARLNCARMAMMQIVPGADVLQ